MARFEISKIVGENCITMEDGQKVYNLMFPELQAGNSVELDFSGVKVFVSLFFNYAIGRLLQDFSVDDMNRLVKISNIKPQGEETLKKVIVNAKRYYSLEEKTKRQVDQAVLREINAQ